MKEQLQTHCDYPSLLSITDTLDGLGIENAALSVDGQHFNNIDGPFLAYTNSNGGSFVVIKRADRVSLDHPGFFDNWTGVVVLAERKGPVADKANALAFSEERKKRRAVIIAGIIIALITFSPLVHSLSAIYFLLALSSLCALLIAILIVREDLGYSSLLLKKICNLNKQTDCQSVIRSSPPGFMRWIKLSDASIIYTFSVWLLLTSSNYTHTTPGTEGVLSVIFAAVMPIAFFSIYYQWRVIKKWCVLCLGIVSLLFLQFFLLLPLLTGMATIPSVLNVSVVALLLFATSSFGWLVFVKPVLLSLNEARARIILLSRFKKDPQLLISFLEKQRRSDTKMFENDLQLANPDAPVQILVACNPYCGPCAEAHKHIHALSEKYENEIGVTIRFMVGRENREDRKAEVVRHILQYLAHYQKGSRSGLRRLTRKMLSDWYDSMDYQAFSSIYPLKNKPNVEELISQYENWRSSSFIESTPTFFLNGYKLPDSYNINDLYPIMPGLIDHLTIKTKNHVKFETIN